MKKCEFLDLHAIQLLEGTKPTLKKQEDVSLPGFATDMPLASQLKEENDFHRVEYAWNSVYTNSPFLRVKTIVFRKGEQLESFVRLRVRDGVDTIALQAGTVIYLLRKTTRDVAHALLMAYRQIQGAVEEIIGYLHTLAGTVYSISRISTGSWTFDPQLAENNPALKYVDHGRLDESQKQKLCELIQECLLSLHAKKLILHRFTLHNVLFTVQKLLLTDLRDLRVVRKKSQLVEDFRRVLGYLITAGIATRADVYQAVVTYAVAMEPACQEWYQEKKGKTANDTLALVGELEQALYL